MILTQKIVAKLDERINRIQSALNYGEKYWNEELRNEAEEELRYLRALRRQVEKHTTSYGECNTCDEYQGEYESSKAETYPCRFIKEVATDLGIGEAE